MKVIEPRFWDHEMERVHKFETNGYFITMSCGGGMGGSLWYEHALSMDMSDPNFIKIIRLSGKEKMLGKNWVVSFAKTTFYCQTLKMLPIANLYEYKNIDFLNEYRNAKRLGHVSKWYDGNVQFVEWGKKGDWEHAKAIRTVTHKNPSHAKDLAEQYGGTD
jgi:hypothetical protein